MSTPSGLFRFPRKTALAASLTLVLMGADITPAVAIPRTVTNCLDGINIAGSLRVAVADANQANSNDTVEFDMAQMQCSLILLTEGALEVSANNLTINGPGADRLILYGTDGITRLHDRVLTHTGTGTLTVNGITITNGVVHMVNGFAHGGCISSTAIVRLTNSMVSGCLAESAGDDVARGGGIYARQVELVSSTVSGNTVRAENHNARGGGIFSGYGALSIIDSTIRDNVSVALGTGHSYGGGMAALYTYGDASILSSTISGNRAENGGGISLYDANSFIQNSTISGNRVSRSGGGLHVTYNSHTQIANSTITGNVTDAPLFFVGGVYTSPDSPVQITSSIIANNKAAGVSFDLNNNATIDADNSGQNLIYATGATVPFTLKDTCPKLMSLANNGGPTQTHALRSTSPAIGRGSNFLLLSFDQRGLGFSREIGLSAVDIGAYERQNVPDEQIFHSGFESGCDE